MTFNNGIIDFNNGGQFPNGGDIHLDLQSATVYDQILGTSEWNLEGVTLTLDFEVLPFEDIQDLAFDHINGGYLLPLITGSMLNGDFSDIVHSFFDVFYDISFVKTGDIDEVSETFNALFTRKAQVSEPAAALFIFMGLASLAYARRRK